MSGLEYWDVNRRNTVHLVAMNGGRLKQFADGISKAKDQSSLLQLPNEDIFGCCPLHYASREDHIQNTENLICLGACINLKNNNKENPLHVAARYGRYNEARQLLYSEEETFIINKYNSEGMTPLHIASQQGHTRVVQLLLTKGALFQRDNYGRNPLHLAAMNGYTQIIELLFSADSRLLDERDKKGNSALHLASMENKPNAIALLLSMNCKLLYNNLEMSAMDYAICSKFPDAALAMVTHEDRAQEILSLKSHKYHCISLALIASMPRVFQAVQDKCITQSNCERDSKFFYIKYRFSCLQCPQFYAEMDGKTEEAGNISSSTPLHALNAMVSNGRVELLEHPLSQKYLQMKWNSYGKYLLLTNLLLHCLFLGSVTYFALFEIMDTERRLNNEKDSLNSSIIPTMYISVFVIITYTGINGIREFIHIYQQRYVYFLNPVNLISWLLYSSVIVMILYPEQSSCTIQISSASLAIFLCWFNLLLLVQSVNHIGIYVMMFLDMLQTLIKVLMVFSVLFIAFGLAFYISLSKVNHKSFGTMWLSMVRMFSMMLEVDFMEIYVHPYAKTKGETKELSYPVSTLFIFIMLMVLMLISLKILLIGLALGDIKSTRKNAQLKRLARQIILYSELERNLPKFLLKKVNKSSMEIIEYPNETKSKLGILDAILEKLFGNLPLEDGLDKVMENEEDYVTSETEKNKRKQMDMISMLETQQPFLRLMAQKMDMETETDDIDEGFIK